MEDDPGPIPVARLPPRRHDALHWGHSFMLATLSLFALLLDPAAAPPDAALGRPELTVQVSMEDRASLDERTMAQIATGVRDIWRPHVDVIFAAAGGPPRRSGSNEVRLVFTDRIYGMRSSEALGWVAFVDGRPSQTITVSLTAVRSLMRASSWKDVPLTALPPAMGSTFVVRALSRAVAHEIGHYLLESKTHTARGLMREGFTADDIMQPRGANDRLDRADIEKLRRGLVTVAKDTPYFFPGSVTAGSSGMAESPGPITPAFK